MTRSKLFSSPVTISKDNFFTNWLTFTTSDIHATSFLLECSLSFYHGSIIYGTDESELILQPHFHFRY
ncbi:hypothetical protein GBM35_09260 [Enterococcus faecium]|nr:hypothetical protein GBM35_09260 [Enterococcus faecium]RCF61881.1 hypothetical protein B1156_04240 [Enterococcus faecium]RCF62857.1 hypothetical protein B1131_03610 [Enterococcus faecium]